MKSALWASALVLIASTPAFAATNSCERVKADISQRIINNGVPETGFTLSIVPNDQAEQAGSQVVGHCANDTQKIIYTRHGRGSAPVINESAPDAGSVDPQ